MARRANPFRPGNGTMPPLLAGRDAELGLAGRLLDELEAGRRPSQDLLLFGPRGTGKTALLLRIAETARTRGLRVKRFPLSDIEAPSELIRRLQRYAGEAGARVTGANLGPFGVSAEPGARVRDVHNLLETWIDHAPLVAVADEFHAVRPAVGTVLLNAVQTAKGTGLPFLLIAAGTPEAPARIRAMGTHNERAFRTMRIGRLERSATRAALEEPARAAGVPFTEEALDLASAQAQDYPYFVQLLGHAAWNAGAHSGASQITERTVHEALEGVADQIASFYGARFLEAVKQDVGTALAPIASLMTSSDQPIRFATLHTTLQRVSNDAAGAPPPIRMLETLSDLGVIWEASDDCWEMGIPSFARYVLQRTTSLPLTEIL